MKIRRTNKDYGGGSGKNAFRGDIFEVTEWHLSGGIRTTITCYLIPFMEINFDGKQEFLSDKDCMEQLTFNEIIKIINYQKDKSFEEGMNKKAEEIKKCLYLSR